MPLPKVPKKFLPKLTSVFLLLYVAATLPLLINRLTSFAYIVQGIVKKSQNAENEATETFRQAIQPNPWDAFLYDTLGWNLSQQGKVEEAIAAYRQAIRLYPEDDSAYRDLGKALIKQGKPDEAIATYRQAIKINPQWTWAYNELGNALYNKWKSDEAIAAYRQAIQINPNYAEAYHNLGNALLNQGKTKEAISAYRQAIEKYPNYAEAYKNLGNALFNEGQPKEAIAAYRQAVKIDPNDAEAYKNLGWILQEQGRLEEAIAAYRQAIQLNLKHTQADNNFAKRISASLQNISVNLLLKETERLLAIRKNPQLLAVPERLPSLKDEPLVLLKRSFVRVIIKSSPELQSSIGWVVKRQGNKAWIVTTRSVAMASKNTPQSDRKIIEVEFYSKPLSGELRKRKPAKIAKITAASDKLDLALLEVTDIPKDIQPLARSSASVALNSPIRIIRYFDDTKDDWTIATGQVINKTDQELRISAISAIVNPGTPVLDQQNRVVGVVSVLSSYNIQTHNQQPDIISGSAVAFPIQSVTKQLKNWGID